MQYEKLAREYVGRSNREILNSNWPIQEYKLCHPLTTDKTILRTFIPKELDIDEILKLTRLKQKELAKEIDFNTLPVDRNPGYIGQIALAEVIREFEYDTSYVARISEYVWDKSGFTLLHQLLRQHFINTELGYGDSDLISGLIKSKEGHQEEVRYEQLWLDRVMRNTGKLFLQVDYMRNKLLRVFGERVMGDRKWTKISTSYIQKLCNCSRNQARRLKAFLTAFQFNRIFSPFAPNLGISWSFSKTVKRPASNVANLIQCSNLENSTKEYISLTLDIPSRIDTPLLDYGLKSMNLTLYDERSEMWTLKQSLSNATSFKDCSLFRSEIDSNPINKNHNVNQRDVFLSAFLLTLDLPTIEMMPCSLEKYVSHYCRLDTEEVERGLKAVRRKNLIATEYESHPLLPEYDIIQSSSQDSPKKIIPYLTSMAESTPATSFVVSEQADCFFGWICIPKNLLKDFLLMEKTFQDTYDLEREIHAVNQFQRY
ncbi:MAG: hypothetical protein ACFFEV_07060, partial [Candidatus Thorarchaeota archaeon]